MEHRKERKKSNNGQACWKRALTPSIRTTAAAAFATPLKTIFYHLLFNPSAEWRHQLPYLPGPCRCYYIMKVRGHPGRDRRSLLWDIRRCGHLKISGFKPPCVWKKENEEELQNEDDEEWLIKWIAARRTAKPLWLLLCSFITCRLNVDLTDLSALTPEPQTDTGPVLAVWKQRPVCEVLVWLCSGSTDRLQAELCVFAAELMMPWVPV